jgi:hypothetical protein
VGVDLFFLEITNSAFIAIARSIIVSCKPPKKSCGQLSRGIREHVLYFNRLFYYYSIFEPTGPLVGVCYIQIVPLLAAA